MRTSTKLHASERATLNGAIVGRGVPPSPAFPPSLSLCIESEVGRTDGGDRGNRLSLFSAEKDRHTTEVHLSHNP